MTRREEYEAKAEQMLTPLMEEHGFELVDVEYVKEAGNWYLRAYVDKEVELLWTIVNSSTAPGVI